mgnify:CR=1 FL=1
MFYVYQHRTKDSNEIFYVGKGKGNRCNTSKGRNRYWHRIVNKHGGYVVEKIAENLDEQMAFQIEMETIEKYKMQGILLTNMTNGGEGTSGFSHPHTEEHKQKLKLFFYVKDCSTFCNFIHLDDLVKAICLITKNKKAYSKTHILSSTRWFNGMSTFYVDF